MIDSLIHLSTVFDDGLQMECRKAPPNVTSMVDLSAPGNPDSNVALVRSESPIDSNNLIHQFADSDKVTALDYSAWEHATGSRPTQSLKSVGSLLVDALTFKADHTGMTGPRSLSGPVFEVWYGGKRIFHQPVADGSDWAPIRDAALLQQIRDVSVSLDDAQIAKHYGGTAHKYGWSHSKLFDLLPGDDPKILKVQPQKPSTTKTENWPSTGAITTGQNNTWVVALGTWNVGSAGIVNANPNSLAKLGYSFGSNDFNATFVTKNISTGPGIVARSNTGFDTFYLHFNFGTIGGYIYKSVSGTSTLIGGPNGTVALNDIIGLRCVGSSIKAQKGGVDLTAITDTAVTTGTYCGLYNSGNGTSSYGQSIFDDLITAGAVDPSRLLLLGVG